MPVNSNANDLGTCLFLGWLRVLGSPDSGKWHFMIGGNSWSAVRKRLQEEAASPCYAGRTVSQSVRPRSDPFPDERTRLEAEQLRKNKGAT